MKCGCGTEVIGDPINFSELYTYGISSIASSIKEQLLRFAADDEECKGCGLFQTYCTCRM